MANQSGDRISSATAQIQETAKWIITAFAGVGAALIAGLQLTGLGKLTFPEILIPIAGLLIALGAVFYAIREVTKVLTPPMILLDDLEEWVGELTENDITLLMGQADDLEQLLKRFVDADGEVRAQWNAVEQAKGANDEAAATIAKAAAEAKDEAFRPLNQAVNFLRRLAINLKVRKAFEDMWWPLAGAVAFAVVGVILLTYMTNRPEDKPTTPPHTTKAVGQSPVGVKLALTSAERKLLAPQLGKKCPTGPLWGMAIGGRPVAIDVVTLPTPRCRSVRVMVTPETGIVIHRSPLRRVVRAEQLARESAG
jgi:hypothetical protein